MWKLLKCQLTSKWIKCGILIQPQQEIKMVKYEYRVTWTARSMPDTNGQICVVYSDEVPRNPTIQTGNANSSYQGLRRAVIEWVQLQHRWPSADMLVMGVQQWEAGVSNIAPLRWLKPLASPYTRLNTNPTHTQPKTLTPLNSCLIHILLTTLFDGVISWVSILDLKPGASALRISLLTSV